VVGTGASAIDLSVRPFPLPPSCGIEDRGMDRGGRDPQATEHDPEKWFSGFRI